MGCVLKGLATGHQAIECNWSKSSYLLIELTKPFFTPNEETHEWENGRSLPPTYQFFIPNGAFAPALAQMPENFKDFTGLDEKRKAMQINEKQYLYAREFLQECIAKNCERISIKSE